MGRLTVRKNQQAVIKVLSELKKTHDNILYLIIGTGPEKNVLIELSKSLGLKDEVKLIDDASDLQKIELLSLSDIFILPTIKLAQDIEGFGIVLLEAQALGLPIICGKSGGELEAIKENSTALVVDANKPEEITMTLIKLLDSPTLCLELGSAGKSNAKNFDSILNSQRIAELCMDL